MQINISRIERVKRISVNIFMKITKVYNITIWVEK